MNILVLTQRALLPLRDGAVIGTYGMSRKLKSYGHNVHIIAFNTDTENNQTDLLKEFDSVTTVNHSFKKIIFNYSFILPFTIKKYYRNSMKKALKKSIIENRIDLVIIDHLHMMTYSKYCQNKPVLLYEHNIETLLWKQYYHNSNFFIKPLIYYNYLLTKKYETKSTKEIKYAITVSDDDKKYLLRINPNLNVVKVPIMKSYVRIKTNYIQTDFLNIVFVASFDWFPNQEAADFIVCRVLPELRKKGIHFKLYLVGKNPTQKIQSYASESIVVTGFVDSIDPYIEKGDIFLNAIFSGSGMNVKLVEAMAKGIPIITSEFGNRGIELKPEQDALIFNTLDECVNMIESVFKKNVDLKKIADNAHEFYSKKYTNDSDFKDLMRTIERSVMDNKNENNTY